jgi:hypothetical protein
MSDEGVRSEREGCAGAGLFVAGVVLGGIVFGAIGLFVGERGQQVARYEEERNIVSPELAKDPAFKSVTVNEYSGGGIWLGGNVHTSADKKRLRELLTRLIGEHRTTYAMAGVGADDEPP